VFQFGNAPALSAALLAAGPAPRPADQLFQALASAQGEASTPEALAELCARAVAARREPAGAAADRVFGGSAAAEWDWLAGLDPDAPAAAGRRDPAWAAQMGFLVDGSALPGGCALGDGLDGLADGAGEAAEGFAGE
jgi:hypothetical protein